VIFGAFYIGLPLWFAVTSWLFARRGDRDGESTVYGRCFAVLLDPPSRFFARIGLTRETARWYCLPLDWDAVVEPSEAEFELTVQTGTGWVERLRRLRPASRVLTQPGPELPEHTESATPQSEDEEPPGHDNSDDEREDEPEGATAEEKQALRRFARRANLGWRTSPANIATGGWTLVVSGLLFGPGLLVFVVMWVLVSPRTFSDPDGRVPGITGMAVFFAIGLGCIIWGLRDLRIWQRVRRSRHELPATANGEVTCWIPYKDTWSPNDWQNHRETLINLRLPDGQSYIFRIPIRYLHRVRKRGTHVRITYLPTTERVQDVSYVEAPAQVTARDSSQGT
jgi:hypothetical protein